MRMALVGLAVALGSCARQQEVDVLVATRNIPKDFALDASMVTVTKIPQRWVQPKALASVEQVANHVTAATIFEGEQIMATKLLSLDEAPIAYRIPKSFRSLAVPAERGVEVRPGTRVDVTAAGGSGTELTLKDVVVLGVEPDAVSLQLSPDDVQRLVLASENGPIRISEAR